MTMARNAFIWHELMSRDPEASERFYRDVAGLTVQSLGDGPAAYRMLLAGGRPVGGLTGNRPDSDVWPSGGPGGHWVGYLATEDVDAAAVRARELGGEVLLGRSTSRAPVGLPSCGIPMRRRSGSFSQRRGSDPSAWVRRQLHPRLRTRRIPTACSVR